MSSGGLARRFCEKRGLPADDALEAVLGALIARGRAARPKIAITDETFVDHLATCAKEAKDAAALEALHVEDLFLACGVCQHDRVALAAFEDELMAQVPTFVLRIRAPSDVVDEVKQKLRERLVMGAGDKPPKLLEYSGKGALGGWLRVTAVRTTLNHLRDAGKPTKELGEELALAGDPELAYVKERASDLFTDAFRRVLDGLDVNERTVLRLHYIDGLTMDQLAHLYKTPRSTIARRVAAARQEILHATEALLRDERRLSPSSIASVIRQARSQLQVTITRLLK